MRYIRITWRRSSIGRNWRQRRVIRSLGLNRLSDTVVHRETASIVGMVDKVKHMLDVEYVDLEPEEVSR